MTNHTDTFTRIGEVLARARTELDSICPGQWQPTSDAIRLEPKAGDRISSRGQNTTASRADLIDLLAKALPFIEDAADDPAYKPGAVGKLARAIRAAVEGDRA